MQLRPLRYVLDCCMQESQHACWQGCMARCRAAIPYLPQLVVAIKALVANVMHVCHLPALATRAKFLRMMVSTGRYC